MPSVTMGLKENSKKLTYVQGNTERGLYFFVFFRERACNMEVSVLTFNFTN